MSRYNNETVARMYANGSTFAQGSNLFIDGETIYSYGYHYPIASRWKAPTGETVVLFNSIGSSVTTEKHKRYVRDALRGETVLYVPKAGYGSFHDAIADNETEIIEASLKASRARKEDSRNRWLNRIAFLEDQNERLKTFIETTEGQNVRA